MRKNFRSQAGLSSWKPIKCRVSRFSRVKKRYVQSGAAYHVFFLRVSRNKVILIQASTFQVSRKCWSYKLSFKLQNVSEKRFVAHDTSVKDYVESLESKNTKEKTKRDVKALEQFLTNEKNDEREVHTL